MKPSLKIVISFFILFHWFCVVAWLFPKPSVTKTTMLYRSLAGLVNVCSKSPANQPLCQHDLKKSSEP